MARPRGAQYQKNLEKRKRRKIKNRPPLCFSCGVPLNGCYISIGDKVVCDWCDDILTKRGYLQISDNNRLYPDGTIREERFVIRDITIGRC